MDIDRVRTPILSCLLLAAMLVPRAAVIAASPEPLAPTGTWSEPAFGRAPLPPMGWNSWNAFKTKLSEEKVLGSAQAIVATGLRDLGYRYVNLDDGWWQRRRQSDGRMVVRTSIFPSAAGAGPEDTSFRPFVDRLHAMQLNVGIYSDIGRNACSQGYPEPDSLLPTGSVREREVGLYDHLAQDFALYFGEWGFDYIKVDGCGLNAFGPDRPAVRRGEFRAFTPLVASDSIHRTQVTVIHDLYRQVRDALIQARPDGQFVFSICNWGTANSRAWGRELGNLWRTSDDIEPRWSRMLYNFDSVATRELYSGPGHWNDPDMLFIGHGDFDADHLVEARTHFALWAIEDAPLIIGYDLRQAPQALLDIWGAPELIAVNQDAAGNQGVIAYTSDDLQIIVKQLSARDEKAVVIFNRGTERIPNVRLTAAHLKFAADKPIRVRDLWQRRDLGSFTGERSFDLAPRESVALRVAGEPEVENGLYLSEMPARVYVAVDGIRALQADPQVHRMVDLGGGTRGTGSRGVLAGWGAPRVDSTPYNEELRIRGRIYASGLGVLANSRLQVRADGAFARFAAEVGLDDSSLERGTRVRFEVYGDGRLLAKSRALGAEDAAAPLVADVRGVRTVELVARELGSGRAPTIADWGKAALTH